MCHDIPDRDDRCRQRGGGILNDQPVRKGRRWPLYLVRSLGQLLLLYMVVVLITGCSIDELTRLAEPSRVDVDDPQLGDVVSADGWYLVALQTEERSTDENERLFAVELVAGNL